jgi:hypothetical protein
LILNLCYEAVTKIAEKAVQKSGILITGLFHLHEIIVAEILQICYAYIFVPL